LALVEPTRAETGCETYDVYEEADGALVLFETWRSRADLEAHQQATDGQDLLRRTAP